MKPIGVLTFIHTMNYGAELQGLALKKSIGKLGYSAEMVNYDNAAVAEREAVRLPGLGDIAHPRRVVKMLVNRKANKERFASCAAFSQTNNVFGPVCASAQDVLNRYAAVVVGSDQVWNPKLTDEDMTFFLPSDQVAPSRKVAYAASFGDAFDMLECGDAYRRAIEGFDAIGIRECYAAEKLDSIIEKPVASVLDPTLLIDCEEWSELEEAPGQVDEGDRFVFVYCVAEHEKALEYACRVARERGIKVLAIDSMGLPKDGVTYVNDASPANFLWYIHHAECVVTSSFHGVCFSVNYGKDFWYSLPDGSNRAASRIVDLLDRLDMQGGEVVLGGSLVDPISVNVAALASQRETSRAFLRDSLAGLEAR